MERRTFLQLTGTGTTAFVLSQGLSCTGRAAERPNIILINADDLGYGDIGCYGSTLNRTPHLDQLAREGSRFTDFHTVSAMCTPSRAALMTGCYPERVGFARLPNEIGHVLLAGEPVGLHTDEITIPELLREVGYATHMVGKWHLGDQPAFLPTRQGFDGFFGLPYSHDVAPDNPTSARFHFPPLPLLRDEEVIEENPDRSRLTQRFTQEAIRFIRDYTDRPFFLYFAHTLPHGPHLAPEKFIVRSRNGAYGACVELIDHCTGELLDALAAAGHADNTLVIFTSDHGNAATEGRGSNGPLRGGKGRTWEGGMRIPCLMRWPGRIPANTICDELSTTMDLLPTLSYLAGANPPQDRIIDGKDIRPLLSGREGAQTPYEVLYYLWMDELHAVRSGPWKLVIKEAHQPPFAKPQLYNLDIDVGETQDLSAAYPDIVRRLEALVESGRRDLGDVVAGIQGENIRPLGRVEHPAPLIPRPENPPQQEEHVDRIFE